MAVHSGYGTNRRSYLSIGCIRGVSIEDPLLCSGGDTRDSKTGTRVLHSSILVFSILLEGAYHIFSSKYRRLNLRVVVGGTGCERLGSASNSLSIPSVVMMRPPLRIGLDLTSLLILLISISVSVDQSESQESFTSSSLSLELYITEYVDSSDLCSSKSKSFLARFLHDEYFKQF